MPAMPALFTRMSMRPNAFTVSSRARSTSLTSVTSHGNRDDLAAIAQLSAVFSAKRLVAVPDRDAAPESRNRSAIALADPLRAAGDDREAAGEVDFVGHVRSPWDDAATYPSRRWRASGELSGEG